MPVLISATPSPYARKVRIALAEKSIPFTLQSEVPWDSTTKTPDYNPIEMLPILILDDGTVVYESHFILEYLEAKFPDKTPLLSKNVDEMLLAKQIEVVVDGVCDATRTIFFEDARGPGMVSAEWRARQIRKVQGGVKAIAGWAKSAKGRGDEFLVGNKLSLADIAVGTLCGFMSLTADLHDQFNPWRSQYPALVEYFERLDERDAFKDTRPFMFDLKDKVV